MGENAIKESRCKYLIFRTSWVYSDVGINFPKKILDLASKRKILKVPSDQIGSPTSADLISDITERCIEKKFVNSIYHLASFGETTRLDLARYLIKGAKKRGKLLKFSEDNLTPILSKDLKSLAKRPKNSTLNCNKLKNQCDIDIPRWEINIDLFLDKYFGVIK
jgi:dTDP-4-dehydrorhamnose reductase